MAADIRAIADEVFATIGTGHQIAPFTSRPGGLSLGDAYHVTALLNRKHEARGEKRLGRKIGFTNRTIWEQYKVYEPIWGYVYASTVHDLGQRPPCRSLAFLSRVSSQRSSLVLRARQRQTWTRQRYYLAWIGLHMDLKLFSRFSHNGNSPLPILSQRTAYTAHC